MLWKTKNSFLKVVVMAGGFVSLAAMTTGCEDEGTACETGYVRTLPCGAGGQSGTYTQACIDSEWIAKSVCKDSDGNTLQDGPQVSDENCITGARRAGVCDDGRPGLRVEQCDSGQVWQPVTACIHGPDGGDFIPQPGDKNPNEKDPNEKDPEEKDPEEKDPEEKDPDVPDEKNNCTSYEEISNYKIDSEVTLDGCFDVNQELRVSGDLTIEPGTVLRFGENVGLVISGGASIYAVGTKDKPISFIGKKDIQGYWGGISLWSSTALVNEMAYVIIDGGGFQQTENSAALSMDTTYSSDKCTLKLRNSIIRNSGHYGIKTGRASAFTAFENNKLHNNADGPALLNIYAVTTLDDASSYSENETDRIRVVARDFRAGELKVSTIPYLFVESPRFNINDETLSIAAGATLTFAENQRFQIRNGAIIKMNGTTSSPVILRGAEAIQGYWEGLNVESTDKNANALNNVVIEDAGKTTASLELSTTYSSDQNSLSIDGLTIRNGANAAISVGRGSSVNTCKNVNVSASDIVGYTEDLKNAFIAACGL